VGPAARPEAKEESGGIRGTHETMKRVFAIFMLCAAFLTTTLTSSRAQTQDLGTLVVSVTDTFTGKPIDNAQVFLLGSDKPQSSLTNAKGLLIFSNLQPALYRIEVQADGYERTKLTDVEVDEGRRVEVAVKLAPTLRTIAALTAHSSVTVNSESVGEDSAQRKVSSSLSQELSQLAGVIADNDLYGADSAFNVSLRNADASQTMYSIDGIHIVGGAAQLASVGQNLFSGSSVSFAPSAGGLGGSVNFFTLQPTKIWNYGFTGRVGNYGNTMASWTVTGGAGKVSLALQHAVSGADSPLNGMSYLDQTGSQYEHLGGFTISSDLFKANVAISPASNLKFAGIVGAWRNASICSLDTTVLPCGNGPGNGNRSHNIFETLSFESLAGHLQYTLTATRGNWDNDSREPNRAVNGIVVPFSSQAHSPWFSLDVGLSETARRHTLSLDAWQSQLNTYVSSTYNGKSAPQATQFSQMSGIYLSDKVKSSDKLSFTHSISHSAATGAGSSFEVYEQTTWQPAKYDVFSLGFGAGSAEPANTFPQPLSDPLNAQYDCYNGSVYTYGPSDRAVRQASQSYNLGWRHTFKGGFVNLNVYRNNWMGQGMFAAVPIGSEPPSLFPGGSMSAYLQQIQQTWSNPAMCGAIPFSSDRVYVNQYISGLSQVNQGVTMSGQIPLGKRTMLFPTYTTASTYLPVLDPRLLGPGSYYASAAQLPHRPLHTAGVILDHVIPRAHLEWLLNAAYTSANNAYNLPGYTVINGGIVLQGSPGSLTLTVGNIFGTHTGLFTMYQGVSPMPLQGGGTFAFATTPLPPRSISVQYQVKWRQHYVPPKPAASPKPHA
jgi:hypothetical protein